AVRAAQDIGLHHSPRYFFISAIEKETRRKIWWGVYTLDCLLALALDRPLAIKDADCDVGIPVELDNELLTLYFAGALLPRGRSRLCGDSSSSSRSTGLPDESAVRSTH
ncbi:hypothetical protein BD311DRAFT_838017, partial [Dichomitus squalens]